MTANPNKNKRMDETRKTEATATAPPSSILAGLSQADIARLVAIGKQTEQEKARKSLGKREKAALVRAKKAVIRDKARKAGLTCSDEEARAWIAAHPPTPITFPILGIHGPACLCDVCLERFEVDRPER